MIRRPWAGLLALLLATVLPHAGAQTPGTITTVAGTGIPGFSGDGGPAIGALLRSPAGVALDRAGNLFIADDGNHRVRKISPDGTITTVAGTGVPGFAGDGGPATQAQLWGLGDVAPDTTGNLFIPEVGNFRVRRISPDGTISTVAGGATSGGPTPATRAFLKWPVAVAVDRDGNLFIALAGTNRIRKVTPDGMLILVAGAGPWDCKPGPRCFSGDGGPAIAARLNNPAGVALDSAGNVYVADTVNRRVRKISPDGVINTVAGNGAEGFSGDGGPALVAALSNPVGLAVDSAGNLFIADPVDHRVRKISPDGQITTVAGGGAEDPGEGGLATRARLNDPVRVAVDREGNLYIAEAGSHRIREVFGVAAPGLLAGQPFP